METLELDCDADHDQLTAELKHFIRCVRTGRTPRVTGEDGRDALALADRILAQRAAAPVGRDGDGPRGPKAMPAPRASCSSRTARGPRGGVRQNLRRPAEHRKVPGKVITRHLTVLGSLSGPADGPRTPDPRLQGRRPEGHARRAGRHLEALAFRRQRLPIPDCFHGAYVVPALPPDFEHFQDEMYRQLADWSGTAAGSSRRTPRGRRRAAATWTPPGPTWKSRSGRPRGTGRSGR